MTRHDKDESLILGDSFPFRFGVFRLGVGHFHIIPSDEDDGDGADT